MTNTVSLAQFGPDEPPRPPLPEAPPQPASVDSVAPNALRRGLLGPAVVTAGAYFGAPTAVSAVVGAVVGGIMAARAFLAGHPPDPARIHAVLLAPSIVLTILFGSGALVALLILWTRGHTAVVSLPMLGFAVPSSLSVLLGVLSGVTLATVSVVSSPLLAPVPSPEEMGALAVAVSKTGTIRTLWCVFALLVAPVAEEVLFRGVLLTGLRERLQPAMAAIAVTLLFTAVHVTQYWRYWPALLFIFLLGLCLAAVRLRYGSLGPAISLHFSFNAIGVAAVLLA